MKITKVKLWEFSAFKDVEFAPCAGINVFLGTNASGKSHAMKALYAPIKTMEQTGSTIPLDARLHEKFAKVYRPDDGFLGRLVRRRKGQGQGWIDIEGTTGNIGVTLFTRGKKKLEVRSDSWKTEEPTVFLPTREVLAMYEGFVSAYQARELSFDETYYDACVALGRSVLRGPRSEQAQALIVPLEKSLGGKVALKGNRFYVVRADGEMEAHLVAEGLRKIACLAQLVLNGSLTTNGILFWDEPEANLNPRLVSLVVDMLVELGKRGVQIFVTTHDYLLAHKLSLLSEYGKCADLPIRFFAFHRAEDHDPVQISPGNVLADLPDNPILDEFAKHYDFERELFGEDLGGSA